MRKSNTLSWNEKKIRDLMKQRVCSRTDFPDDMTIRISKNLTLDDEILKSIWLIKRSEKGHRGEKSIIKAALRFYLANQDNASGK